MPYGERTEKVTLVHLSLKMKAKFIVAIFNNISYQIPTTYQSNFDIPC